MEAGGARKYGGAPGPRELRRTRGAARPGSSPGGSGVHGHGRLRSHPHANSPRRREHPATGPGAYKRSASRGRRAEAAAPRPHLPADHSPSCPLPRSSPRAPAAASVGSPRPAPFSSVFSALGSPHPSPFLPSSPRLFCGACIIFCPRAPLRTAAAARGGG